MAQRVIEMKEHVVELSHGEDPEDLDRCHVRVQAGPVDILLPSALEVCSKSLGLCPLSFSTTAWTVSLIAAQPSTPVLQI